MSDSDLKMFVKLVKDVVKEEIKPVSEQVTTLTGTVDTLSGTVDTLSGTVDSLAGEMKSLTEQVVYLTEKVDGEIIPTLETHTKYLKKISVLEKSENNIKRLDRRLLETEAKLGIQAPPEFQIIE